ncbi:unnamed protein product [Diatraea saccharalis]|uniref:EndoU domain-containing protein n=1 Tax=Diatraea saccharalis TaxID=40085 RepID=A0A9N9RGK2_9NEOP|nr:unnamed protein product [Diatraea saccharalis]
MNCIFSAILALGFIFNHNEGLEYNKHQFTQNTDFLLHESGVNSNIPKKDNKLVQINVENNNVPNSNTFKMDFPPLPSPSSSNTAKPPQNTRITQPSGKRDYVAPNFPTIQTTNTQQINPSVTPQSPVKQNSVATSAPTLLPPANPQKGNVNPTPSQKNQSTGKRDYVNPNVSFLKPSTNVQQGKVKDLVNFYDSKSQPSTSQKTPSYSSILQGPNKNNQGNQNNQPLSQTHQTPKPSSYSEIMTNSNRNTATSSRTTLKPSSIGTATSSKHLSPTTTRRPLIPPSSVVNNNRNQGNNRNSVTETELQTLSEELLRKDINNAAKYITINYQAKTTAQSLEDKAPLPLLTVSQEAWSIPTIQTFVALLDNYERDTLVNEYVTPQERNEENAFMDAIMSTTVIRHLMNFFKEKGFVTPDPKQQRDFLKQLWFTLYSRGKGKISSSGFEHSFVSELKNGEVSGLHNWIYFSKEEQANRLNYLGYLKYEELNGKGAVMKLHFNQQGVDKPVDSLFIGTSPELEIALYTLCYVTRVDNDCRLKLSGKDVNIITYNFRYRSKNLIGSAYPQI